MTNIFLIVFGFLEFVIRVVSLLLVLATILGLLILLAAPSAEKVFNGWVTSYLWQLIK